MQANHTNQESSTKGKPVCGTFVINLNSLRIIFTILGLVEEQ